MEPKMSRQFTEQETESYYALLDEVFQKVIY